MTGDGIDDADDQDEPGPPTQPSSASAMIAALWQEREGSAAGDQPAPPPPAPSSGIERPMRARRRDAVPAPPRPPRASGSHPSRGRIVAAIVFGAVVLGVGVGIFLVGRDGGISSASFIARADAICQPANAALSVNQASEYPGLAAGDAAATVAAANRLTATSVDATGAAGAFGMTACGSGLRQSVESLALGSQSVVKASFVARADALCRAAAVEYADLGVPDFATGEDIVGYLDGAIALADQLAVDLKAIPVPPGDEVTVAEMWAAADLVTAKNRALRAAAVNGNSSGFVAAVAEMPALGEALDVKLDGYGLLTCGSGFEDL